MSSRPPSALLTNIKRLPPVHPLQRIPRPYDYLHEDFVYNFAIGSNLLLDRLHNRLGGEQPWEEFEPAKAANHRLAFFAAICPIEPSMASIEPSQGEEAHGLLLKFRRSKYEDLLLTESGPLVYYRFYHEYVLEVETYSGHKVPAIAFRINPMWKMSPFLELPPSKRYLDLIKEGARLQSLDPAYVQRLEQIPEMDEPGPAMAWLGKGFMAFYFAHGNSSWPFRYQVELARHYIGLTFGYRHHLNKRYAVPHWRVQLAAVLLLFLSILLLLPFALAGHGGALARKVFSGPVATTPFDFKVKVKEAEEVVEEKATMAAEVDEQ